jgi:hypothetical protein
VYSCLVGTLVILVIVTAVVGVAFVATAPRSATGTTSGALVAIA